MKKIDLTDVQESTGSRNLPPGGYICKIVTVADVPQKEYLLITFDIAHGEYKDYYTELNNRAGFWGGKYFQSYKETALGMLKRFVSCVEKSNQSYIWDCNESTLVGKHIGLVLAEEEYVSKDGEIKSNVKPVYVYTVEDIKTGAYDIPALKKLSQNSMSSFTTQTPLGHAIQLRGFDQPAGDFMPHVVRDGDLPF